MGKTTQRKSFISKKLKGAGVVLPLVRMHWLLWGASGYWEKEGEMCTYFRATGTKAVPGKGREFRCKWKNLSWVLQNLSFMDFSASLGQEAVCKPKGQKGSNPRSLWLLLSYFLQFPQNPGLKQEGI